MKTNRIVKLAVLALVMTLVTTSLVSGTYAKYATEVTGTGTAVVAKWVAKFGGDSPTETGNFTFDLGITTDANVDEGKIAPGTQGSFKLSYDTSGSEVARVVKATMDTTSFDLPQIKFYSDEEMEDEIDDGVLINETIDIDDPGDGVGEKTIYWKWPFNGDDTADTAAGTAEALSHNITITFSATQLD